MRKETQAEEEKRVENILWNTGFHGMLNAVAHKTGVSASAIKENLELRVHSRANIATTQEHIKELKEDEARTYNNFKRWREEEQKKYSTDKEMIIAWIQRYVCGPIRNGTEWFRDDFAQYIPIEPHQQEDTKEGGIKRSPEGRIIISPSYFERGEKEKKSILAHELGHRVIHILYPGFVHTREMALYGSENEGRNFGILLAFEEAGITRMERAIEGRLAGECKVIPDCNIQREAALEAYLKQQGIREPKEEHQKVNQKIAELYNDPAKVIRELSNLFYIK